MEWMLQVVDEMDDALGALQHHWFGLRVELGLVLEFGVTVALLGAVVATGSGSAS